MAEECKECERFVLVQQALEIVGTQGSFVSLIHNGEIVEVEVKIGLKKPRKKNLA